MVRLHLARNNEQDGPGRRPARSLVNRVMTVAAAGCLATAGLGLASPAANAATLAVSISVSGNGAATGSVSGIGSSYTSVLTASGTGTCALLNGAVTIADFGTGSGNPSVTTTSGAPCTVFDGSVEYTLTYTSVLGASGSFYRTCKWVIGNLTCSPRGVTTPF